MQMNTVIPLRRLGHWLAAPMLAALALNPAVEAAGATETPQPFDMKGTVPAAANGTTAVVKVDGKDVASTTVKDGQFALSGTTSGIQDAELQVGEMHTKFVLEPAQYTVNRPQTGLLVRGGRNNDLVYGYFVLPDLVSTMAELRGKQEKINALFEAGKIDREERSRMWEEANISDLSDRLWAIRNKYQDDLLNSNESALIKLLVLRNNEDFERYPSTRRLLLLDEYQKELGAHPLVVETREMVQQWIRTAQAQDSLEPGNRYKDITVRGSDGKDVKLSEVLANNRLVLLDFWASWCGPCRAAFPELKKTYEKYRDKGFAIYSISLDTDAKALAKAKEEEKLPWTTFCDLKGDQGPAAKAYTVTYLPATYLIGNNGIILANRVVNENKLEELVRAYLEE